MVEWEVHQIFLFQMNLILWLNLQHKYDLWVEENEKLRKVVKLLYQTKLSRVHYKKKVQSHTD